MKQISKVFLLVVLGFVLGKPAQAQTGEQKTGEQILTLAVVPQYASSQVYRDWSPLLSKLEELTGYRFKLLAYDEFSVFENAFSKGVPDLIYLNPYHLIVAKKLQDYQPLVRDSSPLSGILVILKDGPVKDLTDLNGKTIAFPSPNALGASLYMRALLTETMHIDFNPAYAGSHQNVYRKVLLGDAAAGGGIRKTFNKEPEGLQSRLKVLYTTPSIASHPLAAHPRLNATVRRKIIEAILAMRTDPDASKLLSAVQMPEPVEADYQSDYAELLKLRLDRFYDNHSN